MSVFDSIPYQVQADMLLETIRTSNSEDDSFRQMVELYTMQDINEMEIAAVFVRGRYVTVNEITKADVEHPD